MFTKANPKGTIDLCKTLDIRKLSKIGLFKGFESLQFSWLDSDTGNTALNINLQPYTNSIEISYTLLSLSPNSYNYSIPISWSTCNYGGRRPWFLCPGIKDGVPCHNRVTKLYYKNGLFLCRHCHNLNYMSSQKSKCRSERYNYPIRLIKRKLSSSSFPRINPETMASTFVKPRGMHWSTHKKLLMLYYNLEELRNERFCSFLQKRISLNNKKKKSK